MNEEKIKQKYLELQFLNQQIQQVQQQLALIEQQIIELTTINLTLLEVSKTKKGNKILVPLGAGVYVDSELKDNKEVLMNVGAGVVVKKSIEESKKIVEEQLKELKGIREQFIINLEKAAEHGNLLQEELEELSSK